MGAASVHDRSRSRRDRGSAWVSRAPSAAPTHTVDYDAATRRWRRWHEHPPVPSPPQADGDGKDGTHLLWVELPRRDPTPHPSSCEGSHVSMVNLCGRTPVMHQHVKLVPSHLTGRSWHRKPGAVHRSNKQRARPIVMGAGYGQDMVGTLVKREVIWLIPWLARHVSE